MFDNITHKTETTVTPVTRVIEKSITPDKVSDLYKEIREEVEKNIIQMVRIESGTLSGVVIELQNAYDTGTRKIYTRFLLNGKEYINCDFEWGVETHTKEQLSNKLVEHYTNTVSCELLKETAKAVFHKTGLNK